MSGRRAGIDRHVEREEERLEKLRTSGEISEGEFGERLDELHQESREEYTAAYEADQEDAARQIEDEWGH